MKFKKEITCGKCLKESIISKSFDVYVCPQCYWRGRVEKSRG